MTKKDFDFLMKELKKSGYHIWHGENWCWLSYKSLREKIEVNMSMEQVQDVLLKFKPIKKIIK